MSWIFDCVRRHYWCQDISSPEMRKGIKHEHVTWSVVSA